MKINPSGEVTEEKLAHNRVKDSKQQKLSRQRVSNSGKRKAVDNLYERAEEVGTM